MSDIYHEAHADSGPRAFYESHQHFAGLYETAHEPIIIGLIARADIIYFERLTTGDMRFMDNTDTENEFRYSPTRNVTDLTEGRIKFHTDASGQVDSLTWIDGADSYHIARRSPGQSEEVQFANGTQASLHGTLVCPDGDGPHPAVVVIPQADRTDLWDVGMWLHSRDLAVLYYDQRNSAGGLSTGEAVSGGYQDQQQTYAGDVEAAIRFLQTRAEIDAARIGIIGWSGGGLTGAFVAGSIPELAFYVNIAGDASPGFEQASHMFISRLMREGFSDADVADGRHLVNLHFGVAEGRVSWNKYQAEIERVRDTDWYQYLSNRYSIPYTREDGVREIGRYQAEWPPERVYGRIAAVPTLGVFFEFDHSSSPSSPGHFHQSLHSAGNGNYAIAIIPDTHHGGFVLNGQGYRFDTSTLRRRSPLLIDTVIEWVERQVVPAASSIRSTE
ncbi:MAG: prolyl oligopeptidase family serine peptidase [candidate division Zixibacteria bacterium]|nr:prolyl oligopeptidase family serine peptidase [candidate division Zixibacteria bacterium]